MRPGDGWESLYIDGNLQFDSRDEALYHEALTLPALTLAGSPKNVLVCGGGDGLAVREALRYPGVQHVQLIDCCPEIIDLAKSRFASLNRNAFDDPRVSIAIADALTYELTPQTYDVAICDFTYPTTRESSQVFSVEFYQKLAASLRPGGKLAVNGVSPQKTPEAFACLVATLREAGLHTLPYRVCIPSFREHGYGTWGFVLAARQQLTIKALRTIQCPVETRQLNIGRLWRAASFSLADRKRFCTGPVHRHGETTLQSLILNPSRRDGSKVPPDFPHLMEAVEVRHPYHTRSMIETLAEQIVGSIKSIDLRRLVQELTDRAQSLPDKVREELKKLREFLTETVLDLDIWGLWASRLLAALILTMVIANSISPDPAFAKGAHGLGHSSFSRGFSHQSFGQSAAEATPHTTSTGFRTGYGAEPIDVTGYRYAPRTFFYVNDYYDYGGYYGGGNYGGGGSRSVPNLYRSQPPAAHKPLFVLDDDLMIMDTGDSLITLSDGAYLLLSGGKTMLMSAKNGHPIMQIYSEPKLFESVQQEIEAQSRGLSQEIDVRRQWLSWVSWTSGAFDSVRQDQTELKNMNDLQDKLTLAGSKVGMSPETASLQVPTDAMELFVGCHLKSDGEVVIYQPGGKSVTYDAHAVSNSSTTRAANAELTHCIGSVIKKLLAESQQDLAADRAELADLDRQYQATQSDMAQYKQLQSYGYDYQVDYGTDSLPAYQAIALTQQDLDGIQNDRISAQLEQDQTEREQALLLIASPLWNY